MKIRTGGRPAQYTFARGLVKRGRVTLASIRKARAATGISGNKTEKFISIVSENLDPGSVEPGLHAAMTEWNHVFDNNFRAEVLDLEAKVESEATKQKRILQLQKELESGAES